MRMPDTPTGRLLHTIAALDETRAHLVDALEQHLAAHPDGLALSVADRIAATAKNRALVAETLHGAVPRTPAELCLAAAAAMACGRDPAVIAERLATTILAETTPPPRGRAAAAER